MATWPSDIPQNPAIRGYQEEPAGDAVRTATSTGPGKARPRSTAPWRPYRLTWRMTKAQLASFEAFYEQTLAFGSLEFTMPVPRVGGTAEFQFASKPTYRPASSQTWDVTANVVRLP